VFGVRGLSEGARGVGEKTVLDEERAAIEHPRRVIRHEHQDNERPQPIDVVSTSWETRRTIAGIARQDEYSVRGSQLSVLFVVMRVPR